MEVVPSQETVRGQQHNRKAVWSYLSVYRKFNLSHLAVRMYTCRAHLCLWDVKICVIVNNLMPHFVYLPNHPPTRVWSLETGRPINLDSAISFDRSTTVPCGRECAKGWVTSPSSSSRLCSPQFPLRSSYGTGQLLGGLILGRGCGTEKKAYASNRGEGDQVAFKLPSCADVCWLDKHSGSSMPGSSLNARGK